MQARLCCKPSDMRMILVALSLLLPGCTQFPELDAHLAPATEAADYPSLVPIDGLLAGRRLPVDRKADITERIETRATALKARAERLRGRVLSPAERARLRQRPTL